MTGTSLPLLCLTLFTAAPEMPKYGYLDQPAYSIDRQRRGPSSVYEPQAGDIILFSDPDIIWGTLYLLAMTAAPGHAGLVAKMEDGRLGVVEAGKDESPWVRFTPLDERFRDYRGTLWVRRRKTPITPEQSQALTYYCETINGRRYSVVRLLGQLTPLRSRGPIRTIFLGKPKGIRTTYICSEAVLEGLVYAGLLDAETTRPSATFPRDMFFDRSPNPWINKHLRLCCSWEVPSLWRCNPAP